MKKIFYVLLSIFLLSSVNVYANSTNYSDGRGIFQSLTQSDVLNNTGTANFTMTDNNTSTGYGLSSNGYIGRWFNERVNVNAFRLITCNICTAERQVRLRLFNQNKTQIYTQLITKPNSSTTTGIVSFTQVDGVYGFSLQAITNDVGVQEIDIFEGPDITPPSIPTLSGTAGNLSVTLNWTKPPEADLSMYRIYDSGNLLATINNVNTLTRTITSLNAGSIKSYTIRAVDTDNNESIDSNIITLTVVDTQPPTAITNLNKSEFDNTISLFWTASTDNDSVQGYNIYRNGIFQGIVTGTSFTQTGLVNLINYTYSVTAFDPSGNESTAVNIQANAKDVIPPFEPSTITYNNLSESSINLLWSYTSYSGTLDIDYYRLQRDSSAIVTVDHNGNTTFQHSYEYTGLNSGQNYIFKVWAVDDDGNQSTNPRILNITMPIDAPSTPANVTVEPFDNLNTIKWTPNNEPDLSGYKIYIVGNNTPIATISPATMYAHSPLANNIEVCYQMTAFDTFGNESNKSPSACGTPIDLIPPFDVSQIDTLSSGEYSYSFTFPPSTSPDISHYIIQQNGQTVKNQTHITGQALYTYNAINLKPGINYQWVVLSIDDDGLASNGILHSYTPMGIAPEPPTGLTANAGIGQIQLSWDAHPDPDGDFKHYVLYSSDDNINFNVLITTNDTNYTFTTSSTSIKYFKLKANDNGDTLSAFSTGVSSSALPVTPPPPPPPPPPPTPIFGGFTSPLSADDITSSGFGLFGFISLFLLIPLAIWFAYKMITLTRKTSEIKEKPDKTEINLLSDNKNQRSQMIRKEIQQSLGVKIKK